MPPAGGVEKVLAKLQRHIDSGAYYEAQQMYKSVFHRNHTRGKVEDAYDILTGGACRQLAASQVACAKELALMLVKSYTEEEVPANEVALGRITSILDALPKPEDAVGTSDSDTSDTLEAVVAILCAVIRWTNKQKSPASSAMYDRMAVYLVGALGWRGLGRAAPYFARGKDKDAHAKALKASIAAGAAQEQELFVARAVLQTLAAATPPTRGAQLSGAKSLMTALQPLPHLPLIHFCEFMLQALAMGSGKLYDVLRMKYEIGLDQDDSLQGYLMKIEQLYLNRHPPPSFGGIFGDMLKAFSSPEGE